MRRSAKGAALQFSKSLEMSTSASGYSKIANVGLLDTPVISLQARTKTSSKTTKATRLDVTDGDETILPKCHGIVNVRKFLQLIGEWAANQESEN